MLVRLKGAAEAPDDRLPEAAPRALRRQVHASDFDPTRPRAAARETKHEAALEQSVGHLDKLQRRLFADQRFALLTVFQAMDAAGKDSTIRKVFSGVNPAGFRVHAFGRPSELELRHDFLQRVAARLPERGKIGIFNRSHYEEVLVVRMYPAALATQSLPEPAAQGFLGGPLRVDPRIRGAPRAERHRHREVLAERVAQGAEEAPARSHRRPREELEVPARRPRRPRRAGRSTRHAYEAMLRATSRPYAPWYAIPADDKDYMRAAVAKILVETLERVDPEYPKLDAAQRRELKEGRKRLLAE